MSGTSRANMRRNSEAIVGMAFLVTLATIASLLIAYGAGVFQSEVVVTTRVASVGGGLPLGSDVKLRGLTVGRVAAVDVTGTQAVVTLDLDPNLAQHVPASVESRILPANVFGVPFVDLKPAGAELPAVQAGAVIRSDNSAGAEQLARLYDTAVDVLGVIQPAKLDSALTQIASALSGQGVSIGHLIDDSASYLSQVTPNRDQFATDITRLATLVQRTDASAPTILVALDNARDLARLLIEKRQQLLEFLAAGAASTRTIGAVVNTAAPRLIQLVHVGAPVFAALAADSASPEASLLALGRVAVSINRVFAAHHGIMVRALVTFRPFPTYTAADCPRYGALAGANCTSSRSATTTGASNGGNVGPVGSAAEANAIAQLLGVTASGLDSLIAGPALRGASVVTR